MLRYSQLIDIIVANKCTNLCEIGTHNGNTAKAMIKAAAHASPGAVIAYHGFDLFEDLMPDTAEAEFHGKAMPNSAEVVYNSIVQFAESEGIKLVAYLSKGNTNETLKECAQRRIAFGATKFDICFVDGGHSIETCRNDITWAVANSSIVVCDDYYTNRDDVGCKTVVEKMREDFILMPLTDVIRKNDLHIAMAVHPVSAYPWTRYIPLFGHIKQLKPKKVFAYVEDEVLGRHLDILRHMFKYEFVDHADEDLDLSIIQCESEHSMDLAFGWTLHAKSIVVDGVEGDQVTGFSGPACDVFRKYNRTPIYPQSADRKTIAIWPSDGHNVALNVKTRNCVEDGVIKENIQRNMPLIKHWVAPCKPNGKTAVIVSAGSSLKDPETIRTVKKLAKKKDHVIFCVKHSHNYLISNGIVPFGCILLDPRDHVKYFIENPHEDVTYFVASMCHYKTTEQLAKKEAKIIGYHARVSASLETLKEFVPADRLVAIPGGSAASTRAISLLHCLGFRKFECLCYDLNYAEKPKRQEKTHQGFDKFVHIESNGREFWTDLELIAQANDIKAVYENIDRARLNDDWANVIVNFHGNNFGQHTAKTCPRLDFKYTFEDVVKGIDDDGTVPAPRAEKPSYKIIQG